MNGQPFNRRNFCALVGSTAASLALGSACRRIGGSEIVSDGRLTARPRLGVKTSTTGQIMLKARGYDVTFCEFDGDHEIPTDIAREGLLSISK